LIDVEWIRRGVLPFEDFAVGSLVPTGFGAYARVAHPDVGTIPADTFAALVGALRKWTQAPESVLVGIWEGRGWVASSMRRAPDLDLPHRRHLLFTATMESLVSAFTEPPVVIATPSLFWPADRAWYVATDIDLDATYVGGSLPLIEELVGSPELKAVEVLLTDSIAA
jgi:hypothetical protein